MELHITVDASTEGTKIIIPSGSVVLYNGHVIGGMISVTYNEVTYIIHPNCTEELNDYDHG